MKFKIGDLVRIKEEIVFLGTRSPQYGIVAPKPIATRNLYQQGVLVRWLDGHSSLWHIDDLERWI